MGGRRTASGLRFIRRLVSLLPFVGSKVRIILNKDIKAFFRDPAQWSQFFLFFGFIGLYFLNLRSFAYDETDLRWKSIISFLNLSAVSMTLATLNSRFVFPQISLEGTKFWIMGLMPVTRREIVHGKFYFAFLSGWIISSLLILLSNYMLKISWNIRLLHLYTVFLISFGLAGISVGAGAMWPNFRETVPSKIISGLGGTLNLIISVFFVLLVIFVLAIPCHYFIIRLRGPLFPSTRTMIVILSFATVTAFGAGLGFINLGVRRFKKMEVF
jgi:ABC-2 type transport system permease protein